MNITPSSSYTVSNDWTMVESPNLGALKWVIAMTFNKE